MTLKTCPKCKKKAAASRTKCLNCGASLEQAAASPKPQKKLNECPKCQGTVAPNVRSCPHCGHRFTTPIAKGCLGFVLLTILVIIFAVTNNKSEKTTSKVAQPKEITKPAYNPPNTGKWITTRTVDPLTSTVTGALTLAATSGASRFGKSTTLIIRCKNNTPEMYINWHQFINNENTPVTTRLDQEPAKTAIWKISNDNEATFYPHDVEELISKLTTTRQLVAQTTPYNESPATSIFNTRHLTEAFENIQDTCPF